MPDKNFIKVNEMKLYKDDIERLERIRAYINSNLGKDLRIETIAQNFSIGRHSLGRHFLRYYKVPIHQYVLDKRMKTAYRLLLNKVMPVHEVFNLIGYKDKSTFSHAFSAYFGISPKDCSELTK